MRDEGWGMGDGGAYILYMEICDLEREELYILPHALISYRHSALLVNGFGLGVLLPLH